MNWVWRVTYSVEYVGFADTEPVAYKTSSFETFTEGDDGGFGKTGGTAYARVSMLSRDIEPDDIVGWWSTRWKFRWRKVLRSCPILTAFWLSDSKTV